MHLIWLESVDSTQEYLKQRLRDTQTKLPLAVVAQRQTAGVGSRGNAWSGLDGNLFLSFAFSLEDLPKDLKIESCSIYFAYLLKETLAEFGSEVWLKWPNDFYMGELKIGGMITNIVRQNLVCGVGLNLVNAPEQFGVLDITISKDTLLEKYFIKLQKKISWKQVFSKYELEFHKSKNFFTHNKNIKISLEGATLQSDGSIVSNGERIFSLR